MLRLENISFAFDPDTQVLHNISLEINKPSITTLLGPSGCGKSTLLRLIAGLETVTSGSITTNTTNLGFVFQEASLMPWATVEENVSLPLKLQKNQDKAPILEALEQVGMANLAERYPQQLSGGQRMRVSIARALASKPDMLLMDEPFAALDEILRFQMNEMLLGIQQSLNIPVIFVTHSIYEACYLSDEIYVMQAGKLRQSIKPSIERSGPVNNVRSSPAFLGAVHKVSTLLSEEGRT